MLSTRVLCFSIAALLVSGCATTSNDTPSRPQDACSMLRENNWGKPLGKAARKWDARPGLILAIMYQESGFRSKAKPARQGGFLFLPGKRPSDAYGYAQAKDDTWEHYEKNGGGHSADRDDFADAADFVGWYLTQTEKRTGVPRNDAVRQYLAYHEGAGGYLRGTYRKKKWLTNTAETVGRNAASYDRQIGHCSGELKGGGLFGLF
ncbi:MAG: transglycosylase SLT domain-containing protein [Caulobacterales bacterium]